MTLEPTDRFSFIAGASHERNHGLVPLALPGLNSGFLLNTLVSDHCDVGRMLGPLQYLFPELGHHWEVRHRLQDVIGFGRTTP